MSVTFIRRWHDEPPLSLAVALDREKINEYGERPCWEVWSAEYDLTADRDDAPLEFPCLFDEVEDFEVAPLRAPVPVLREVA